MSITNSVKITPEMYKYAPYEALSFKVGGTTEIIGIANNAVIESGHPYPSDPTIYEITVNGRLLFLISGSVSANVTLSMYYAFDEENFYLYDERDVSITASGVTISGVYPFPCGYWKFQITPNTSGTYTALLKIHGI